MTIDLLGNVVIVDKVSTDNLEITNGTILITEGEGVALDVAKFTRNVILTNDKFVLVDNLTKWQYIKCCLRLAWARWKKMTVCGIKHADGVCVMGECPHFKRCCPVVWDKSGKPMNNEEWFNGLSTYEKAFALETIIRSVLVLRSPMCHDVCNREFWEKWLKEKHNG